MGRLAYIFFALAALGAAVLFTRSGADPVAPANFSAMTSDTVTLTIGTGSGLPRATVVAEVADTPQERARGLGGRESLEGGAGMWFVFEEDGLWPFWMKDTLVELDIIWVSADGTIVTIAHGAEPDSYPQSFAPTAPARYVLEVPGGFAARHGIAEGDKIIWQAKTPL